MPSNTTKAQQRFVANYPKIANLKIPTPSEIAVANLCYPPTPSHKCFKSYDTFYDIEGDVLMRNK